MFEPADPATAAALARLYDLDLTEDPGDLDLYLALAGRVGDPILELAAGSGRLAVPLAAAGHRVTAVDFDAAMLTRARDAARAVGVPDERLELVDADLRTLALPGAGTYQLAFIGLNSIMLLASRADQRRAVQVLADHLALGGLAVVDIWLPDAEDLARFDGRVILEWPRPDPETGAIVTKAGSAQYDAATGTVVLTAIYEEGGQGEPARRWIRRDRLRLLGAHELAGFAEDAGLHVERLAGGYDLDPLAPGAERAILIAERR
jgi:SAM-dependent methyltransferase